MILLFICRLPKLNEFYESGKIELEIDIHYNIIVMYIYNIIRKTNTYYQRFNLFVIMFTIEQTKTCV